jgi:hypothetical protein
MVCADDMVFGLEVGGMKGMEGAVDLRGTRRSFASGVVGWPGGVEEPVSASRSATCVGRLVSVGLLVGIRFGSEMPLWREEEIVGILAEYSDAVGAEIAVRMLG